MFDKTILPAFALCMIACAAPHDADPQPGPATALMAPADGPMPEEAAVTSVPIPRINMDAIFVIDGGDNAISVFAASDGAPLGTIRFTGASFPHHIYASPDGYRLAVAFPNEDLSMGHAHGADPASDHGMSNGSLAVRHDHGTSGGAVAVIEAATGRMLASRRLPMPNHNAVFSPDGLSIWTTQADDDGTVLVLDSDTLATRATIPVGMHPQEVTLSKDGKRAFVANGGSNDVTVVDVTSRHVVTTIPVGMGPVGAWPGEDGLFYVDNEMDKSISVIDPAALTVLRTITLDFTPGMAHAAATGELWVTADEGKVVSYDASGSETARFETAGGAHGITFSPDGARGFVTNQMAGSLSIFDAATHTIVKTIPTGKLPNGILFHGLRSRIDATRD